ncbi:TPA: VRR-NUC domain-containing protein [Enterobacter hormaechei subsp. xiangfangensis]|nr:VRR-NUC domain-containing protein [Enterobacter hormaechei subsp. xiangfangensis]
MGNGFDANWLMDYQAKRQGQGNKPTKRASRSAKVADIAPVILSPHLKALNYLAKHPEDLKGKQEHYAQVKVMFHFECSNKEIYRRLHATPNGGHRTDATAGRMKAEGQKRGYPDMSLDKGRGVYLGLRCELKIGKNTLSQEQKDWLNMLTEDGYYCFVAYGEQEAIDGIQAYWDLGDLDELPPHHNDRLWRLDAA